VPAGLTRVRLITIHLDGPDTFIFSLLRLTVAAVRSFIDNSSSASSMTVTLPLQPSSIDGLAAARSFIDNSSSASSMTVTLPHAGDTRGLGDSAAGYST
jgi:hypothetical protein